MAEPGWFPDPGGEPGRLRYWNGASWSYTTVPEADFRPPAAPRPTPQQVPAARRAVPPPTERRRVVALVLAIIGSLLLAFGLLKLSEVPPPITASTAAPTSRSTAGDEECGKETRDTDGLHWAGLVVDISSSFTLRGTAQLNGSHCLVLLTSPYDPPYEGYYLGWLQPPASVTTAEQAAVWIGEEVADPYPFEKATVTSSTDVTVDGHDGVRVRMDVGTSGSLRQDVVVLADGGRYAFLLRPYSDWETPEPDEPVLASFRIG